MLRFSTPNFKKKRSQGGWGPRDNSELKVRFRTGSELRTLKRIQKGRGEGFKTIPNYFGSSEKKSVSIASQEGEFITLPVEMPVPNNKIIFVYQT